MKKEDTSTRLKKIMSLRNLRQIDILRLAEPFCKKLNVKLAKNDLSQYISKKVEPGADKLTILALALNINEVWLMGYDVPMDFNFGKEENSIEQNQNVDFKMFKNGNLEIILSKNGKITNDDYDEAMQFILEQKIENKNKNE